MRIHSGFLIAASAILVLGAAEPARADDDAYNLTIKDHRFAPETLELPAGKKVRLVIKNLDGTAEEFDSPDLHREKVIPAGKEGVVFIGPLESGVYKFTGEYNSATARGQIIAK